MKHQSPRCSSQPNGLRTSSRGELFLTVSQGPWWGLSTVFFFFFQSESGGPSVKALERPARSRKHKVITRLPFREQVPQTNSTEETEAFKVALHESPRFSGDSLEKLLFDQAIVNLCSGLWTCVFRLSQTDTEMFEHYHHHVPQLLHHLDFFPDR